MTIAISIIVILLLILVLYYFHYSGLEDKYKQSFGELEKNRSEIEYLNDLINKRQQDNKELEEEVRSKNNILQKTREDINILGQRAADLGQIINEKKEFIDSGLEKLEKEKKTAMSLRLATEQEKLNAAIKIATETAQEEIEGWTQKAEDARKKYLSVIEVLKAANETEETHKLQIPEKVRQDISYLIETVIPRMNNKELINKLIWTEYIQCPMKEMLDNILPDKECSGIYKITHVETKKSYIGRSTNVYKRLQEHVKSSCGISTIADQKIHHAMRDEGVWNFYFELLEQCDKSQLSEREKYYINFFQTEIYGYNQKAGG